MILKETRVMRGPNMWSYRHPKLIVLKLDFTEYETVLNNNTGHLLQLLRTLPEADNPRTEIASAIVYQTVKLANYWQGLTQSFSAVKQMQRNVFYAVFSYEIEEAGLQAADEAVLLLETMLQTKALPAEITSAPERIRQIIDREFLGPSTHAIVSAARQKNIPVRSGPGGYIFFRTGKTAEKIKRCHYGSHKMYCGGDRV